MTKEKDDGLRNGLKSSDKGAPVAATGNLPAVWAVLDCDYDDRWIVSVYASEHLAAEHSEKTGLDVERFDVLRSVSADVVDTRAERAEADRVVRAEYLSRKEQARESSQQTAALTFPDIIGRGRQPSLCHCATFTTDRHFITSNGYCRYCGGWTPEVFRQHLGDSALEAAIDLLAHHDRVKMRELTGLER